MEQEVNSTASVTPTATLAPPSVSAAGGATLSAPRVDGRRLAAVGGLLAVVFLWAYWPTLAECVQTWNTVADYGHGYFVIPLAVYFLWARWDRFPAGATGATWPGLVLVLLSVAMRLAGAYIHLVALDGWSILLWVAGVVWLLCGTRVFWWALPSIVFLGFMIRLPFRLELGMSLPLQTIATHLSCWVLQMLGQPALAEGHTIYLGDNTLEIEQACSGLRIFMGIGALAFAYVVMVRRVWWEKAILLASVVPIALAVNAARVVITGLLYQYVSGEAARKFSHDLAGWIMLLLAVGLCVAVHWYLGRLIRDEELLEVDAVMRRQSAPATP